MSFNIYNFLIIVGIVQGIIFSVIIPFNKKYHAKSTFFLIALIFSYSFSNLQYILPDIGSMSLLYMYAYIFIPIASFIAPTIYFFVILFLYPGRNISKKEKFLLAPFIIFTFLTLIFRGRIILGIDEIDPINPNYHLLVIVQEIFAVFFNIAVLIITLISLFKYEKLYKEFNKNIVRVDLQWLKITLSVILFFTVLWGYLVFQNTFGSDETLFYSLWLGMTALIYWLGHIGIYKYGILADRRKIRKHNLQLKDEKVQSESLSKKIIEFENLMIEEKLFLDSKLTLDLVAKKLDISASHLSRSLKSELNKSFTDYINELRVNEAKSHLNNSEFKNYTIIAIGLEAGFNSRSSFFSVFKKITGETPSSYRKRV